MSTKTPIAPLLQSIIKDNPTYKFPVEAINKELLNMFVEPLEFEYFMMMSYKKLKREFGNEIAHIFLQTIDLKMNESGRDIQSLSVSEFQEKFEGFMNTLENLYFTRIDKNSPDGEMMSAMID